MLTAPQKLLLGFNLLLVLGFGWYYFQAFNFEFLAYAATVAAVVGLLFGTLTATRFPTYILAGITIWAVLHMLGGSLMTPDGVLYAYRIYPFFDGGGDFYILKMDQVVHAFLYGVVGLMFYHLLREVVGIRTHAVFMAGVSILAAVGFSILNEIIEFIAAISLPQTGVGGYYNTVLDLVFNLTGAAVAVIGYQIMEYVRRGIS